MKADTFILSFFSFVYEASASKFIVEKIADQMSIIEPGIEIGHCDALLVSASEFRGN